MKILLIIIIILSVLNIVRADDSWKNQIVSEDSKHFYYLGIGNPKLSKRNALDDAYREGVKELIKHQFGYKYQYLQEQKVDLDSTSELENSVLYQSEVKLTGVKTMKFEIEDNNGSFTAYQLISYEKSEASHERKRLLSKKSKNYVLKPKLAKEDKNQKLSGLSFQIVYDPVFKIDNQYFTTLLPIHFELVFFNKVGVGLSYRAFNYENDLNESYLYKRSNIYFNYYPISYYRFQIGIGANFINEELSQIINEQEVLVGKDVQITPSFTMKYQFTKSEDRAVGVSIRYYQLDNIPTTGFGLTYSFE